MQCMTQSCSKKCVWYKTEIAIRSLLQVGASILRDINKEACPPADIQQARHPQMATSRLRAQLAAVGNKLSNALMWLLLLDKRDPF